MFPKHVLIAFLLIGCVGSFVLTASAAPTYDLSTAQSIDTPEQTVNIHGNTYTITSITTAAPDSSVTVDVTVPDDTSYAVDLYNDDEQVVVDPTHGIGSGTVSVTTEGVAPGTYALTLQADNDFRDVQPLVVEGYDVSLSAPASVEAGAAMNVSVEATPTASSGAPAGGVEVVAWNGDTTTRVDAEAIGDGAYRATIDGLEAGEYDLYAAALGSDTVMGEPEVLGATGDRTVTVTDGGDDPPDDGGDDPSDGDDGDGSDGDGGDSSDGDGSDDSGGRDGEAGAEDGEAGDGTDGETDTADDGSDAGGDEGGTSSENDTIEPSGPPADGGDSDEDPVPGFGIEAALVLALAALAFAIRRVD